jgi:phosphoheptose isomerase/choline kinase
LSTAERLIDAVILCGGKGERLRPVVQDRPKSLVEVAGRPFLEWLVIALANQGLRRIVLATGVMGDAIETLMGDGRLLGVELVYSHEAEPTGTAGAVALAASQTFSDPILVVNGDSYCRFNVDRMLVRHRQADAAGTMWLQQADDAGRFGAVRVDAEGRIVRFLEKGERGSGLISCGVYLLGRSLIEAIPTARPVSLERDIFPKFAGRRLWSVVGQGIFIDIGTPEALAKADNLLHEEFRLLEVERKQIEQARAYLDESLRVQQRGFAACAEALVSAANAAAASLKGGGKVLLCGNGGSAADCQHVATELVGRLSRRLTRPAMAAIALTTDSSFLTAYANDVGFEGVFARQVEGLGRPGDVLIGISTSGGSPNVVRAVEVARRQQMVTMALVGEGGRLAEAVDYAIVVPDRDTQHIQETMLPLEHLLCLLIEEAVHGNRERIERES